MQPKPQPKRLTKTLLPIGLGGLLSATLASPAAANGEAAGISPLATLQPLAVSLLHDGDATGGWSGARPDGHAPIGVMGDHVHAMGGWMVSYRYMAMEMKGSRDGTDNVSNGQVLGDFLVTPTEMTMEMHMLGAMHAINDTWTFMVMVPFLRLQMDHVNRMGVKFTTETEGLGDVGVSGLATIWKKGAHRAHVNLGLSVPTGSIDETDDTPLTPRGTEGQLPYPMQLGSGTWDLRPGLTYLGQDGDDSWGAQGMLTLRTGENDADYRLGNRQEATTWYARRLNDSLSVSFRLGWAHWSDIHGADSRIAQVNGGGIPIVPTADPGLRNGSRVDASVGTNLFVREGAVAGHRLAFEFGVPLYQDLDGPQLETDWILTLGWQLAF